MHTVNYIEVLESIRQVLDDMEDVLNYVNGLRESLNTDMFYKHQHKIVYDEIELMSKCYRVKMIEYCELIKTLNTIIKYNAHQPYSEPKLDEQINNNNVVK